MGFSSRPAGLAACAAAALVVVLAGAPALADPPGRKGADARRGPPAHAPAHGYRHKLDRHPDIEVVFDATLGVYAVAKHRNVFFWRDHFYRLMEGRWQVSAHLEKDWLPIPKADLPHRLLMHSGGFSHGHTKPSPPAKKKR